MTTGDRLIKEFKITDEYALIDSGTSLTEAARKLLALQRGVLLVKSTNDVIGVVFDKSIIKPIADGKNPLDMKVDQVMNSNIHSVKEEDKFASIVEVIESKKPAAIIVKSADGSFRGYFSPVDYREALIAFQSGK